MCQLDTPSLVPFGVKTPRWQCQLEAPQQDFGNHWGMSQLLTKLIFYMQSIAKGKACTLCQIAPWWPEIIASRRRLQWFQKDLQLDNLWENGPRPSHLMTSTNTCLMRVLIFPVGYVATGHLCI